MQTAHCTIMKGHLHSQAAGQKLHQQPGPFLLAAFSCACLPSHDLGRLASRAGRLLLGPTNPGHCTTIIGLLALSAVACGSARRFSLAHGLSRCIATQSLYSGWGQGFRFPTNIVGSRCRALFWCTCSKASLGSNRGTVTLLSLSDGTFAIQKHGTAVQLHFTPLSPGRESSHLPSNDCRSPIFPPPSRSPQACSAQSLESA